VLNDARRTNASEHASLSREELVRSCSCPTGLRLLWRYPVAAFGENKQSGVGQTLSTWLLDALTEPKTIIGDIGAKTP
jgi:hypothetical protein